MVYNKFFLCGTMMSFIKMLSWFPDNDTLSQIAVAFSAKKYMKIKRKKSLYFKKKSLLGICWK